MSMTKEHLIAHVANETGITKKEAKAAVESVFEFIMDANENGDKVQLIGFGSFTPKTRKSRKGVNPQTKKPITIKEQNVTKFTQGKAFKDRMNK